VIEKLIVAGSGGQGVMLLGKVLAEAAMRQGRQVSWFPAYGAEVRGGHQPLHGDHIRPGDRLSLC